MIKQLLFFLALILTFSSAFAQVKQAEKEMAVYNFTEAVALLQKALEKGDQEEERKVVVLLAECYRMLNDWPQEKTCYRRAISLGETSPENYFFLAQAYRVSGDYEEARRLFLQSDDLDSGKLPGRHFAMSCDSALLWLQRDPGFEVQNLALLNSPQSEFGAVVIPSGLLSPATGCLQEILIKFTDGPAIATSIYFWQKNHRGECLTLFSHLTITMSFPPRSGMTVRPASTTTLRKCLSTKHLYMVIRRNGILNEPGHTY